MQWQWQAPAQAEDAWPAALSATATPSAAGARLPLTETLVTTALAVCTPTAQPITAPARHLVPSLLSLPATHFSCPCPAYNPRRRVVACTLPLQHARHTGTAWNNRWVARPPQFKQLELQSKSSSRSISSTRSIEFFQKIGGKKKKKKRASGVRPIQAERPAVFWV